MKRRISRALKMRILEALGYISEVTELKVFLGNYLYKPKSNFGKELKLWGL